MRQHRALLAVLAVYRFSSKSNATEFLSSRPRIVFFVALMGLALSRDFIAHEYRFSRPMRCRPKARQMRLTVHKTPQRAAHRAVLQWVASRVHSSVNLTRCPTAAVVVLVRALSMSAAGVKETDVQLSSVFAS